MNETFQIEQISPDFANEVLQTKNKNNRGLKKGNLDKLVKAINNNEWTITNQGIAFDRDGNLIDGQHRLQAIVNTGKTLPVMVARNMDPNIFHCVDKGIARTAADCLFIEGCTNPARIAAGIKVYLCYQKHPEGTWRNKIMPTHIEIINQYNSNKELWDDITYKITIYNKKFSFFPLSVAIAIYKLILDENYHTWVVERFFTALTDGANLEMDDPILSFRNQIIQKNFRTRGSSSQRHLLNSLIKLFNYMIENTKVKKFMAPATDIKNVLKITSPKTSEQNANKN